MLIDTHCHLDFKDYEHDIDVVLKRAKANGIGFIINVGSSMHGTQKSIELAQRYDFIFAAIGIHPHEADKITSEELGAFSKFLDSSKIVAVGEIGLDYYKNLSSRDNQKKVFSQLLEFSRKGNLPLIIHNRDAHSDTMAILKEAMGSSIRGVMHCFSGDEAYLKDCLDLGFFISFTCNITFKNASRLRDICRMVPLDRLLIETDAPFLAPQIFRGMRNEPMYLRYAAEEIASIKGMSLEQIAMITTENAKGLFGFNEK